MDFVDDFGAVKKTLLGDDEFQLIAAGSNEETNITGSADPVTTGGHSDTVGRRMISNIGCEDCAGAMRQWLRDTSANYDDTVAAGWLNLAGDKDHFIDQWTQMKLSCSRAVIGRVRRLAGRSVGLRMMVAWLRLRLSAVAGGAGNCSTEHGGR